MKITSKCPDRSPLAIVEPLKKLLSFRTVCDIGCREGDIMIAFKKYADKVIGIDWSSHYTKICEDKGLTVFHQSYWGTDKPLPEAELYYAWVSKIENEKIAKTIDTDKHILILGGDPSVGEIYNIPGSYKITVPYDEGPGEREHGIFELTVIGDKNSKQGAVDDRKTESVSELRDANPKSDAMDKRVPNKPAKPNSKGNRSNRSR